MITLFLVAIAISMDSFFIAFTYGLKKMGLSIWQMVKIAVIVGAVFSISLTVGAIIVKHLSESQAEIIAGAILVILGTAFLLSHAKLQVKPLSIWKNLFFFFDILKKPLKADIDQSGKINGLEVYILGIALSLDSFGAGVAISMLNVPIELAASLVALITFLFLMLGIQTGKYFAGFKKVERLNFIPGCILIVIGISKIVLAPL
ncbi:sporulation membrane protein YtaF [Gracilibacillus oryzae]|uniref:Sporulation membrane protein YtaF n=1 Tax=Gracilibacillus oryzae TaxID=1672701 RepID=A0A7C8GU88_9BACI|nr:manganese efflux pump [Gracilibacillus oryzae]KAB8138248.1 sporulation membrane protein YtaF [Gracilibacillus oryzae]